MQKTKFIFWAFKVTQEPKMLCLKIWFPSLLPRQQLSKQISAWVTAVLVHAGEVLHIQNSPPADGALLVRMVRGAPDGGRCKCPSSGSFHSTFAPAPFFCLITNLSCGLPQSSHLAGCYADGTRVASDSHIYTHEEGKLKPGSEYYYFGR